MSIEQIMMVEMDGLSQTIKQYTCDNFVQSYADQITSIAYPAEKDKFILLVDRLYEWYMGEIDEIKSSEFLITKNSHLKSFSIIQELKELLEH